MLSKHLLDLLDQILKALHSPSQTDPIRECPLSVRAILSTNPASLIKLSHTKIHSYPFSEVPVCWRRLFTDASIYEAIRIVTGNIDDCRPIATDGLNGLGNGVKRKRDDCREEEGDSGESQLGKDDEYCHREQDGNDNEDWVQRVVRLLDMAVIMTGAPAREGMIEEFHSALQQYMQYSRVIEYDSQRKRTRRTYYGAFPTDAKDVPVIRHPIALRPDVSMSDFERHMNTGQPLVIQHAVRHWPALTERPWKSPEYLMERTFGGRRLVPVEVGRSYTDEGWGQKILTFRKFMDEYLMSGTVDDMAHKYNVSAIGYLAQHDLFTQIPSLRADISIPDYCYTDPPAPAPGTPLALKRPQPKLDEPLLNAWFGPAGTVSPLHTDPYHNILCQVVGKKYIRLYDPHETEKLYPRGVEGGGVDMSNTSEVDVEAEDEKQDLKFPLFREARYVETILSEGECLYIPVGWWHYVRSLTVSFSVSFWWN